MKLNAFLIMFDKKKLDNKENSVIIYNRKNGKDIKMTIKDNRFQAIKIIGGIQDQCWSNQEDMITWVQNVLDNIQKDIQTDMSNEILKIQEENLLSSEFETDARYIWPKRWNKIIEKINKP